MFIAKPNKIIIFYLKNLFFENAVKNFNSILLFDLEAGKSGLNWDGEMADSFEHVQTRSFSSTSFEVKKKKPLKLGRHIIRTSICLTCFVDLLSRPLHVIM